MRGRSLNDYKATLDYVIEIGETRVYPKVSGLSHKELYAYLWYYSLRSNTKGYGGKPL